VGAWRLIEKKRRVRGCPKRYIEICIVLERDLYINVVLAL